MFRIPFNKPLVTGREIGLLQQAIEGGHLSGDGPFSRRCRQLLEETLGAREALLTTSGTHALEMAALLLDLQPGDEVIVPSFTFVSTANAFALRGARPVFADIRPDTQNLDEGRLERLVTPRTRAIVPVHYGGIGCEMDAIGEIAQRHGLAVVEDNAHGLFGTYRGRSLGTLGCLGAQSFHETKNFTCGEGGALLINDLRLASRAEIVREKGTNRSRFLRGEVDKYTWVDLGSSYLPSDLLAAFLYAQLEARETIQSARRRVWTFYHERLRGWAEDHRVRLPSAPPHCGPSYHLFYLILPTPERRQELGDYLRARGIQAVSHYPPLHLSGMGQRFGGKSGDCPVTEEVCPRLIRLPFYAGLTDSDLACVTDAIHEFH